MIPARRRIQRPARVKGSGAEKRVPAVAICRSRTHLPIPIAKREPDLFLTTGASVRVPMAGHLRSVLRLSQRADASSPERILRTSCASGCLTLPRDTFYSAVEGNLGALCGQNRGRAWAYRLTVAAELPN